MKEKCNHLEIRLPWQTVSDALEMAKNGSGISTPIHVAFEDGCYGRIEILRPGLSAEAEYRILAGLGPASRPGEES